MTESILLQFINNVYTPHHDYCIVCLRTREERRLEQPNYLKKFLLSINQPFVFHRSNQLVCFVCERQAAVAFRFRVATNLASQAHSVVQNLQRSPALRIQFSNKYATYNPETSEHDFSKLGGVACVLDCEAQLRRLRARTRLLQTEVLVVCTPAPSTHNAANEEIEVIENSPENCMTRPGESSDLFVVPDDAGARMRDADVSEDAFQLLAEPEIEMASIVIFDDDDPITIIKSEDSEPLTIDTPTSRIDTPTFRIDNPTSRIDSTTSRIDTTTSRIDATTSTIDTERMDPIENLLDEPALGEILLDETRPDEPANFILHPIVFNSGMMTVPSLAANILNGRLVTSGRDSNFVVGTPNIALQNGENIDFISDPAKVSNVLKMLSHQDAPKVHVFTSYPTGASQPDSANENQYLKVTSKVKVNKANKSNKKNKKDVPSDVSTSIPDMSLSVGDVRSLKLGESRLLGESRPLGESRLLGESRPLGESRLLGESRPLGESRLLGESRPLGESRLLGESRPLGESRSGESKARGDIEARAPPLRTDRIDWEDKIPMDVISFVDADENSSKRARLAEPSPPPPPLGIICNVTSLSQGRHDDVIDLC